MGLKYNNTLTQPSLAVRLGLDSGIHRLLENPLSINGAEGSKILRFLGSQAAAAGWPEYGGAGTLALQAGTAPTYGVAAPYLGPLDGGCQFNNSAGFADAAAALGDITTEDWVIEAVFAPKWTVTNQRLWSKQSGNPGVSLNCKSNGHVQIHVGDATGSIQPDWDFNSAAFAVYHVIVATNRDEASANGCCLIRNGALFTGTSTDVSARAGSSANAGVLSIGQLSGGGQPSSEWVALVCFHARSAWLQAGAAGPAEIAAIAKARFALLTASRPAFSAGGITSPASAGSTSPVYQLIDTKLHYMGAGTPCFERIVDAAGRVVVGHLVEVGVANHFKNNRSTSAWSVAAGTPGALAYTDSVAGDTLAVRQAGITNADIYWQLIASLTASKSPLQVQAWFRRVSTSGTVEAVNNGYGSSTWSIDLAALPDTWVLLGRNSPYVNVIAEFNSDSLGRCSVCYRSASAAPVSFDVDLMGLTPSNDVDYVSSPIITTTAAVTRAAAVCRYTLSLPRAEGTLLFNLLGRSFTPTRNRYLFSLNDGTTNNRIEVYTDTSGRLNALSRKSGGLDGDCQIAGSVFDNYARYAMLSWRADKLELWLCSFLGVWTQATNLVCNLPAGSTLTTLCIGHDWNNANQAGPGLYPLSNWKLLPKYYSHPLKSRRFETSFK